MEAPPPSTAPAPAHTSEHVVHLNTPNPHASTIPVLSSVEGTPTPTREPGTQPSILTGSAPIFVPGAPYPTPTTTTASAPAPAPVPGIYRPKLKLAFNPGDGQGQHNLAQRRKHRRNVSSGPSRGSGSDFALRARDGFGFAGGLGFGFGGHQSAGAGVGAGAAAYGGNFVPNYPPGISTPGIAIPAPADASSPAAAAQEHPLVRFWKHHTAEELDRLQNALQDLMFTASRLVDEDARRLNVSVEQRREEWEMREAQRRLAQWVEALVLWREGLPVGDLRSKG